MDMLWSGWGDPERAAPLSPEVSKLLQDALGTGPAAARPVALADVAVPEPRLGALALSALASVAEVRTDAESRIRHTRGKSTPDLLRMRAGEASDAPDAVVLPEGPEAVLDVLKVCAGHRIAVVPFGGGTSVVGGLAPSSNGFIALDLRRLDRLLELDPVSRTATLQPGLRGPRAEELLNARGFTMGHFPQSFEWASVGGFAAARSSGQASAGYGRFDDMVVGLTVATPAGELDLGRAPRSAAGPDLRQLILGSEGAFGVITSVTVRVRPVPETRVYEGWRFESFAAGTVAMRRLAQDGPLPTVLRLSDETETLIGLARPAEIGAAAGAGCLAVAGFEGSAAGVIDRRAGARSVLEDCGGTYLGTGPGKSWMHGRYAAPYLRDALLDAGAFAETLETAAFWSDLPGLYAAVREALTGAAGGLVMCHVSHVYPSGASLYFTIVTGEGGRWPEAKRAAGDAILAAGGTISHHHGIGTDHLRWYAEEIGPVGVRILRAVKRELDPDRILNPGILIP